MSLQNYTIPEAAAVLRCKVRFLEDNLAQLPHQKIGREPVFDETELAEIKDMFRVRPAPPLAAVPQAPDAALTLSQIRPSRRSRRSAQRA